jgi:hypothetical protein
MYGLVNKESSRCLFMGNEIHSIDDIMTSNAPVAQLDRALVSGTKGRTFESYRVYQKI